MQEVTGSTPVFSTKAASTAAFRLSMPLSGSLSERLSELLTEHLGIPVDIEEAFSIGGGSINDAHRLETNAGRFFLKTNSADRFPSMFKAEAEGLQLLGKTQTLGVPKVIAFGEDHDDTFLLLEFVESTAHTPSFWNDLGNALAHLHRNTASHFGLQTKNGVRHNYIGSLVQTNTPHADWPTFFIQCRLEPMLRMARDKHRVEAGMAFRFERLFAKLNDLFPGEAPALLHGDLWSGNFLAGPDGRAFVFDPAAYYGHREMDLAMTRLFGGFDPELYAAYHETFPLEKEWEDRVDLCNLYPLLVHVNLFGGGYVAQVENILKRFV